MQSTLLEAAFNVVVLPTEIANTPLLGQTIDDRTNVK